MRIADLLKLEFDAEAAKTRAAMYQLMCRSHSASPGRN